MKFLKQLIFGLVVLLPFAFAILVPLSLLPIDLRNANLTAHEAFISGESETESGALNTILAYTPWRGDLWQRAGRLALNAGDFGDAVISFSKAKDLRQLNLEGTIWMADALTSNGEIETAKSLLRELSLSKAKDAFLYLQAAGLQRKINDPYGALATLLKAYALDPTNEEINYQLGLQLSATQPDSAIKFLTVASENNVNRKIVSDSLISTIRQTIENEAPSERFIRIGQILSTFEEWDVAQRAFQMSTAIDPTNATAWALLAEAEQQNGLDGLDSLRKAINLAPEAEIVNGLSALYYRRLGKPEQAIVYLQKALEANPSGAVWEIEIGNTLAGMGDLSSALQHFQLAIKISPNNWVPYRALAAFCISHNYEVKNIGLDAARQSLILNPGSPVLMDLLGTGLMITGDLDSAERFFLQADKTDPYQTAILIHLGQLNLLKGNKPIALDYFRLAAGYAKDNRLREMANNLLTENGGR